MSAPSSVSLSEMDIAIKAAHSQPRWVSEWARRRRPPCGEFARRVPYAHVYLEVESTLPPGLSRTSPWAAMVGVRSSKKFQDDVAARQANGTKPQKMFEERVAGGAILSPATASWGSAFVPASLRWCVDHRMGVASALKISHQSVDHELTSYLLRPNFNRAATK